MIPRAATLAWLAAATVGIVAAPHHARAQSPGPPIVAMSAPCPVADAECAPPPLVREFRGVWIATVANMDWPSRRGLPTDSAKAELLHLLDQAAQSGLNAVIFQVRPAGDALYKSSIEPWSEYLTGVQGHPPDVPWDPLAFAVKEAHARGLELHAWFNPYRAKDPSAKGPLAATHLAREAPGLVRRYAKYLWFDPGEPAVRKRTVRVVLDVLARYDVDGIHLDDYFYPYPEQRRRRDIPFPDAATYAKYRKAGGKLDRDDWRRENVDKLIDTLRLEIAKAKPWVKFGVSPFGIWRPGEPETVRGFDAFAKIFADARKWLVNGWVDYLVPQIYWAVAQAGQPFSDLLHWWLGQNPEGRFVWAGLADFKINEPAARWRSDEILQQVDTVRATGGASGAVHFPMKAIAENVDSLATRLARGAYASRAVVPAMPWKGDVAPRVPAIAIAATAQGEVLTIARHAGDDARWWAIQVRSGDRWATHLVDASVTDVPLSHLTDGGDASPAVIALTPVSRTGVAGDRVAIRVR